MQSTSRYYVNDRFLLGVALNSVFILVELYYGFKSNSMALVADAVHNAGDVVGLILIWFSYYMARRQAPRKFTYGYKNATIFAAFLNAIVLFVAVGNLVVASFERLFEPQVVASSVIILVAGAGVVVNGLTALLFLKDRHKDINIQGVFLNMAFDAAISVSVVIAGFFMLWKGWTWIDPVMGLVIAVSIITSFWSLFKESINLIFQAVPASINLHEIVADIEAQEKIISYHDLHVWALSTTETALSVHVVTSAKNFDPVIVYVLAEIFRAKYDIHHATIQLEAESSVLPCGYICKAE